MSLTLTLIYKKYNTMMIKITDINGVDLNKLTDEVFLNKRLTKTSKSNMYEILFECNYFNNLSNIVVEKIKETNDEDFDVYIKNMWGYIQTDSNNEPITIPKYIKEDLSLKPKYSFVFVIESNETILQIENEIINVNNGDLLIFRSENFVADKSIGTNRVMVIGSLTNNLYENKNQKFLI